jgi:hypothetical protein
MKPMKDHIEKEKLYSTAYCPLFKCYVKLTHVYRDVMGRLIFVGENEKEGLENHLFRKCELERFTL